jgi:hypothetical protein
LVSYRKLDGVSPDVIRVFKSRRLKWEGHVERMRDMRNKKNCFKNLNGIDHSEDLGVDGRIILEMIVGKWGGKLWTGFIRFGIGTNGGLL